MNKCPSCKAEIQPNIGVCEYCGFIINHLDGFIHGCQTIYRALL